MLSDEELDALCTRGLVVRDGLVGEAVARAARAEADRLALAPAGMSEARRRDAAERGDLIGWLDDDTPGALADVRRALLGLEADLNARAFLGLGRAEVQVARYPGDGARYVRHRDAFASKPGRRVTAIVYLNPGWRPDDGGLLRAYLADGAVDVEPRLDRLVIFLATEVEHEVLPAFAPRVAVTAWFHGREDLPGIR